MKKTVHHYDLLDVRITEMQKALKLQAKEYKRRLEDLNGEARKLHDMQQTYVPREVHEATVKELRKSIADLNDYKNGQQGRWKLLEFIPWMIAAITGAIAYFKK